MGRLRLEATIDVYLKVQECLADLMDTANRSQSMLFVRLNELCTGCDQLFRWAEENLSCGRLARKERENVLHVLSDKAEACKSQGEVNADFRDFLQKKLLKELNDLRTDILADSPLAS